MAPESETVTPRPRRWRRWVGALAAILAILWLLLVSSSPIVAPSGTPTPELAEAGRQVLAEVSEAQRSGRSPVALRLGEREVRGVAVLASDAAGIRRVRATMEANRLVGEASLPLIAGQWINVSAAISGRHTGFPAIEVTVGRLALPAFASRALLEVGRWIFRMKGLDVPPLNDVVESVSVAGGEVEAELRLPARARIIEAVTRLRGQDVDAAAVSRVYCRLVALRRGRRDVDLPALVRTAFAAPAEADAATNRGAFVALAMAAVGTRADALAPRDSKARHSCGTAVGPVLLGGRADLAKHWTLSAALTAVFGADAAGSMGEWKELADSRPSGSGFSFVDLAADRSAVHIARMAAHPDTARQAALRLSGASEESLLPLRLLAAQEGLSERQFEDRYQNIESAEYQRIVERIDRELARSSLLGGAQ